MIFIKRITAIILAFTMCLVLAACSSGDNADSTPTIISEPQANPVNAITGAAADAEKSVMRPIAVSVNNKQAAWPQRGTASADAVIEMATENVNTHMLLIFSDYTVMPSVGPVAPLCDAQAQLAMGINAVPTYIGATVYADNLLNQYGYMTIDGKYLGKTAIELDVGRALALNNEYSRFTNSGLISTVLEAKQIETKGSVKLLNFIQPDSAAITLTEGDAPDIGFNFTDANYTQLTYNADSGLYQKQQFSTPQTDELTGEQLAYKNVVILSATLETKPDNGGYGYDFTGGTGYYVCGGKYQTITWTKGAPDANFVLTDANGKVIEANTGKTYIAVLASDRFGSLKLDVNAPEVPAEGAEAPAEGAETPAA